MKVKDKQTIQAIKDSIVHWEQDILKPLKDGRSVIRKILGQSFWSKTKTFNEFNIVKYRSEDCPLCNIFIHNYHCGDCPLKEISCCMDDESSYRQFVDNPCIETAEAMIETLKSLLPKESCLDE
jgi:hypothetical protein